MPAIEGLEEAGYWANREATTLREVPESAVFVGGGPVAIELGQMLARLGSRVTIVHNHAALLKREDPRVGALAASALEEDGVELRLDRSAVGVAVGNGRRVVELDDGSHVAAERLVLSAGRRPRTDGLGLDTVGIEPGARGIPIDERCRAADGVWAIGDVTGVALFTHAGKYQARIATGDILGRPARADYRAVPRVVFSDPEIAGVGLTPAQARELGIDAAETQVELADAIARPYTYEESPRGTLSLLADRTRGVLVGAWAVAPLASEWIHYAALAIRAQIPLDVLEDTIVQFPTYTEGYLSALRGLAGADGS